MAAAMLLIHGGLEFWRTTPLTKPDVTGLVAIPDPEAFEQAAGGSGPMGSQKFRVTVQLRAFLVAGELLFRRAATGHVNALHTLTCLTPAYQFRTGCC